LDFGPAARLHYLAEFANQRFRRGWTERLARSWIDADNGHDPQLGRRQRDWRFPPAPFSRAIIEFRDVPVELGDTLRFECGQLVSR
jgi:hypothetical protein